MIHISENIDDLIDHLVRTGYITTPAVKKAFQTVERANYYDEEYKKVAYWDFPWGRGDLSMCAPSLHSEVLEGLQFEKGLSFLNIGSGTGYLNTVAGLLIGRHGINHGVEVCVDAVAFANEKLEDLMNTSSSDFHDFCPPHFVVGNGLLLDARRQQYDRVYCAAFCPSQHIDYLKSLLKVGGILIVHLHDWLVQIIKKCELEGYSEYFFSFEDAHSGITELIEPSGSECLDYVMFAKAQPSSLQEICRRTIRLTLHEYLDKSIHNVRKQPYLFYGKHHKCTKRRRVIFRESLRTHNDSDNDDIDWSCPKMLNKEFHRKQLYSCSVKRIVNVLPLPSSLKEYLKYS